MTKKADKDKENTALVKREDTALSPEATKKLDIYKQDLALAAEIFRARKKYIMSQLKEGVHYGTEKGIPKPFLHKPGAETVGSLMETYPVLRHVEKEMDMETGWISHVVECDIIHKKTGQVFVQGFRASANSFETKRRFRWKDGQRHERDAKDLLGDDHNILTMAEKRAHVGASIIAAGISDQFTYAPEMVDKGGGGNKPRGPKCYDCGKGEIVEKTARKGKNKGNKFWACTNYPNCTFVQNEAPADPKTCKHDGPTVEDAGGGNKVCGACFSKLDAPKAPPGSAQGGQETTLGVGMAPDTPETSKSTSSEKTEHKAAEGAGAQPSTKEAQKNDPPLCRICGKHPERSDARCPNESKPQETAPKSSAVKLPKCTDCGNNLLPCIAKNGHHYWAHKTGSCQGTAQMTEEEKEKIWPNRKRSK